MCINDLICLVEEMAGVKLERSLDQSASRGVAGWSGDNALIRAAPGWQPCTLLETGMEATCVWWARQYADREAVRPVARD
jgi:GDP-D-mannose 3',5'-epimerase